MHDTIQKLDVLVPCEPILLAVGDLYQRLCRIPDRRADRGKRYSLAMVLTIAILAKLAGEDTCTAIAHWAKERTEELCLLFQRQRIAMPHGSTWSRIFAHAVDPHDITQAVAEVLAPPTAEVPERGSIVVNMDGKTLRGTIPRGSTQGVHLLAAYVPNKGVVLFQVEVPTKENEIVAAPRVIHQLDLTGVVVTADAMHTQRELSIQIVEQGGDYLWPVKQNQPTLAESRDMLFDPKLVEFAGGAEALDFRTARTVDAGHGRIEERCITVSELLNDYVDWPYVAQVFRLETTVTDKATEETWTDVRYGITSQPATVAGPKRLLAQVRQGWSIETGLHGRRDGTLREDASRVRTGDGPHVLAVINNTVVGLALQDGQTNLAEARRKYDHSINRRVTVLWVVHQIQQAQHGNPACAWSKNMVLSAGRPSGMPALGFG